MHNSSSKDSGPIRNVTAVSSQLSNREFLERYAKPGWVGLASGLSFVDRAIARAERRVKGTEAWGEWTHAFVFSERRSDGQLWLVESDLQIKHKHIQLGVQENRISKYYDQESYTALGVFDFALPEALTQSLVREALDQVASRARYSLRELLGTLIALKRPKLRERGNLLARDHCFYCSAFVRYLFAKVGIDLAPGIDVKHTTPEDIARSPGLQAAFVLQRQLPTRRPRPSAKRIRQEIRTRWRDGGVKRTLKAGQD